MDSDPENSGDAVVRTFSLPYGEREIQVKLKQGRLQGIFSPHRDIPPCPDPRSEIRRALADPIDGPPLKTAVRGSREIVLVCDDMTRLTPQKIIIPAILEQLNQAGIQDDQISILIGLGTHRGMTGTEIISRFGKETVDRIKILNHPWQDPDRLQDLGTTGNDTPVTICKQALEADFLLGVGTIVPHHIPGFSGGAKIIQPGITGAETTGATHLLSIRSGQSLLGELENPVRKEIEDIAHKAGLSAIFNCVLDSRGRLVQAFYGDFQAAFRKGAETARRVYGVRIPAPSDIVVAGSWPCDIEFWQAHKSLYPAGKVVKPGGRIIIATPCPEGVAVTHPEILDYAGLSSERLLKIIEKNEIKDKVSGALALAWAQVREHAQVHLVSDGISDSEARALGFKPSASVEDGLEEAIRDLGSDSLINVLTHAPDMLPILPAP